MKSTLATKITSETSDPLKDLVKAYGDLKVKSFKLEVEIREFKLLCRAYFASKTVAKFSKDSVQAAEAVLKEAEFEKRILRELEDFTRRDVEELPFKD